MSLRAAILWALGAGAVWAAVQWVLHRLHWYSHLDREHAEQVTLLLLLATIVYIVWALAVD